MDANGMIYSEFMFVISPPDEINGMIDKYKTSCANHIGNFDSRYSKAHISVAGPKHRQMPVMMNQVLDCYAKKLGRYPGKEISVNGFNYFTNPKYGFTVYTKVEPDAATLLWFKNLRKLFGANGAFIPHITIAKGLSVAQFNTLWPYFVNRKYCSSFLANRLTILSRPTIGADNYRWTVFRELRFKPQSEAWNQL